MSDYSIKKQVAMVVLIVVGMAVLGTLVGCGGEYVTRAPLPTPNQYNLQPIEGVARGDLRPNAIPLDLFDGVYMGRYFDPLTCVVVYTESDGGVAILKISDLWGVLQDGEVSRRFPGCSRLELR